MFAFFGLAVGVEDTEEGPASVGVATPEVPRELLVR